MRLQSANHSAKSVVQFVRKLRTWSPKDIIRFMLLMSKNCAGQILLDSTGAREINEGGGG